MANRVTVWWQGEEYDAVRQNGVAAQANTGSTWQVLHDGAALTSFAAEPGEAPASELPDQRTLSIFRSVAGFDHLDMLASPDVLHYVLKDLEPGNEKSLLKK